LVVDDELQYRLLLSRLLELAGYHALAASDGRAALELAATERPDLVILDICMPLMDGLETCRKLRDIISAPIIFLTVFSNPSDRARSLELGAAAYLTKPFNSNELLEHIRNALQSHSSSC
jgi:DNA-binding response OmpR family regulator